MASKWDNRNLTRTDFVHEDDSDARAWATVVLNYLGFSLKPNENMSVIDFKVMSQSSDFSPIGGVEVKTRHVASTTYNTTVVEPDKWQEMQATHSGLLVFFTDGIKFFDYESLLKAYRYQDSKNAPDENPYTHKADRIKKQFVNFDISCASYSSSWQEYGESTTPAFVAYNPNKNFK